MSHGNWNFELDQHCTESTVSAIKSMKEKKSNGYTVESKATVNKANGNEVEKEN